MAMQPKVRRTWKKFRLTPEAAAKGNAFVDELLRNNMPLEVAKAALGQLMVTRVLAANGGSDKFGAKKAAGRKLHLTRDWVREINDQTKRKSECLIPLELVVESTAPGIVPAAVNIA